MDRLFIQYDQIKDITNNVIAGLVATALLALAVFFKDLPRRILIKYYEKKNEKNVLKIAKLRRIQDRLKVETGALYVHIIKYSDTNKPITPASSLNETVLWEEVNRTCGDCPLNNPSYRVPRLQDDWYERKVQGKWIDIVCDIVQHKDIIVSVSKDQLDTIGQSIFDAYHIEQFKGKFLRGRYSGFYILGVSFCFHRPPDSTAAGHIATAVEQIKKLL